MFVFCCVFASMIFEACQETSSFVPVGVAMHTVTVLITCLASAAFSSLPISIAGPDVNPALFFAIMAQKIVAEVSPGKTCSSTHSGDDGRVLLETVPGEAGDGGHDRWLSASPIGDHYD